MILAQRIDRLTFWKAFTKQFYLQSVQYFALAQSWRCYHRVIYIIGLHGLKSKNFILEWVQSQKLQKNAIDFETALLKNIQQSQQKVKNNIKNIYFFFKKSHFRVHLAMSKFIYYNYTSNYYFFNPRIKDNQMRSPSLSSGPKIRKAYFEASNPKMLIQWPPLKSDFNGGLWSNIFLIWSLKVGFTNFWFR